MIDRPLAVLERADCGRATEAAIAQSGDRQRECAARGNVTITTITRTDS